MFDGSKSPSSLLLSLLLGLSCMLAILACGGGSSSSTPKSETPSTPSALTLSYPAVPTLVVGTAMTPLNPTVSNASSGVGTTFAITSGALPAGVTLDAASGVISGTPTTAESFSCTIKTTNGTKDASTDLSGSVFTNSGGNPKTALHPGTQQLIPSGTIDASQTLGYAEYVPVGYPASSGWPLIIYFHGDGALGTGDSTSALSSLLNEGIPMYINLGAWDSGKRFVVLSPQMKDYAARSAANVDSFIQFAKANYKIDPARIYLSSLSGGGAALYRYLYTYSGGEAAAVIPVSSVTDHSGSVCGWKQVPIWIFHGESDKTLNFTAVALPIYEHLKACSPAPVPLPKLTGFAGIDHEARAMYPYNPDAGITLTSDGNYDAYQNIYDWLLQYHK